ncbi:MAG: ribosome-associated heat shock protein Hsp15 [Parashewanella sp.]
MTQKVQSPVRLDKWLWAARFYKTRAIAKQMIDGGKVHYNGQRTKSSKNVEIGARLQIRQGYDEKEVVIQALCEHRGNATQAQILYDETEQSIKKRELSADARRLQRLNNPAPDHRPDKKQRRQIVRFKQQPIIDSE